jgi:formylglycine-generating enzyme required for sulfatase activity
MTAETRPGPAVVAVPAGAFVMGAAPDDKFATDTERPAHRVAIRREFALGRFPVTVGEYRSFRPDHEAAGTPDLPVTRVSWDDARAFCAWLRHETGAPVRLPSEAEWEYACRAGAATPFATGEDIAPEQANFLYAEDGRRIGPGAPTAPGRYPPNRFGLHDLHGNVCEWVEDAWHAGYAGAPEDGAAWLAGGDPDRRVIRGGAWDYLPRLLRCAWRDALPRDRRRDNVGFRVAWSLEP